MSEKRDSLDQAMALDNINILAAQLRERGVDLRRLKAASTAMSKGPTASNLVELESAKAELEGLLIRLRRREKFSRGIIDNMRWAMAGTVFACFAAGATLQKVFSAEPEPKVYGPGETLRPQPRLGEQAQGDKSTQGGPDFLKKGGVELHGLALLVHNNDQFDRYIFNSVTGNRQFAKTFEIQGGYPLDFGDRQFTMPYHAFLFKAFNRQSNVFLPKRLGDGEYAMWTPADCINTVTRYRASDEVEIKTIIATSYELSFGIKIAHEHIQIVPTKDGRVAAIKYTGPNPENLIGETPVATSTSPDPENPERRNLEGTERKRWGLVDSEGELIFPPSVGAEYGMAIPPQALPNIERVTYTKTFTSQGRRISVKIDVPIDSVLAEQKTLRRKREPQSFYWDEDGGPTTADEINDRLAAGESVQTVSLYNLSWYVPENDPLIAELAHAITDPFETSREKAQAILDFLHEFHYVPDAYGEAPRTPRVSLISRGGDCEDSSILGVALARAVGIECIFLYLQDHAAPACDVSGPGTAIIWNDGKHYEWAETTGGVQTQDSTGRIVEDRAWRVGEAPDKPEYRRIKWTQRVGGPLLRLRP